MNELPNPDIWQRLLSLESRDIVQRWFVKTHSRQLSARRAREINASARQAREFFRNANNSYYSVRPLLTFYGVACLSRALLLFLKVDGGEEGLSNGHGLETVRWGNVMSGNTASALGRLGELRIRRRGGLFSDFMKYTENRISIHINSAGVDWRMGYDIPNIEEELSLDDLFSRIPDLRRDYSNVSETVRYTQISDLTYNHDDGFSATANKTTFLELRKSYEAMGYIVNCNNDSCIVTCNSDTLSENPPMFIHSYMDKMFGLIPVLYMAEPFPGGSRFSQLCITYMISYILGMLVRYYPSHWISLVRGDKGDLIWPTVNRAQQLVERFYPELVAELVNDAVVTHKWQS